VFEAAVLIVASREKGLGIISVPIASRYEGSFRLSYFSPVRDVMRISMYTAGRVFHYGSILASYNRSRAQPLVIDDRYSTRAA